MKPVISILQMIVSIALIILILIQARGTGFGRSGSSNNTSFTRRGLEKLVFRMTFIAAILFITLSILQLVY